MLTSSKVAAFVLSGLAFSASIPEGNRGDVPRFARRDIFIEEAPLAGQLPLAQHPNPKALASPARARIASLKHGGRSVQKRQNGTGNAVVNTIFDGVYPVVNLTWGNKDGSPGQQFSSFIDTGSSDSFAVASNFQCVNVTTRVAVPQSACGFGPLFDATKGKFTNITTQQFSLTYFPENVSIRGSMGYAPITLGGLTVPSQEVALVEWAAWAGAGDGYTSGLLGLGYPPLTSATSRNGGRNTPYDPLFTTMVKQGIVKDAVFTLALDRVPRGTSYKAPAGLMALGGLVPDSYYNAPFTSVAIEPTKAAGTSQLSWYTTTHEFLYGLANGTVVSAGTFQSIVDSGTAPNFIPSAAAKSLNAQFVPPATYNASLDYWTVDCNAKAPYAAYKIGGKVMPMDPRDMIVRSLNGLQGYENVCFSAFGDGGSPTSDVMLIGEVWQRSYVISYDQGRSMMHFADRKPY